jgi:hypothetical protein
MRFARPKTAYEPADEARYRDQTDASLSRAYARGESVELWPGTSVILRSPNGARWRIQVSNAGVLSAGAA